MTDEIFDTPSSSPNFQTELAEKLSELVPEAIAEGKINFLKLQELLEHDATDTSEVFGLHWPGKKAAMRAAQLPTRATLLPNFENSRDWDTTKNVFIEGDNFEVLKILQKHYHGKIRLIYIDPPYNTGNDFVYRDDFRQGLDTYLKWTGQIESGGSKSGSNPETDGRFHTNWLNMMYPRLKLARNLLAEDGFIFVSISDGELSNLRAMMNEIFSEACFVETFIWQSIFRPSNMSNRIRRNAEYVVCYQRSASYSSSFVERLENPQGEASLTQNNNSARILRFPAGVLHCKLDDGVYNAGSYGDLQLIEPLVVQEGKNKSDFVVEGKFKWKQEYLNDEIAKEVYLCIKSDSLIPYYRKDYQQTSLRPTKILPRDLVGDVLQANAELDALGLQGLFDYPKPTSLVEFLIQMIGCSGTDIVLDFFAGSGTTAHAVMQANARDGEKRRSISVQLPEPLENPYAVERGIPTIAALAMTRISQGGAKLLSQGEATFPNVLQTDLGFRAFKLADSNFKRWRSLNDSDTSALVDHLLDLRDSADNSATPDALLFEILLKQGHSLTENIDPIEIAGLKLRSVADGIFLVYLNEHVKPTIEQLRAVVEHDPERLIVLEDSFHGDDELKTNLAQLCKSKNIEFWTA
jgi:adenine-specific DNA-methyltransferase